MDDITKSCQKGNSKIFPLNIYTQNTYMLHHTYVQPAIPRRWVKRYKMPLG